jgi:hypothetical protein
MANWPNTLPKPALAGFGIEPQEAMLATQMEAGPKRYRKRFTNVPEDIKGNLVFNAAQMAEFKTFYKTTINQGADWFVFDGLNLGSGFVNGLEVHFKKPYTANIIERGYWTVNFDLEVRNA